MSRAAGVAKTAERPVDAEGLTLGSQDDEPAECAATTPVAIGVIPLISIDDAVHTHVSNSRPHYMRSSGPSVRSFGSNMSSMSGTMRSCGLGSLRRMLGSALEAPPRLTIPRERLRVRRSEVFGKGAYGLVVRGELYGGECIALSESAETHRHSREVSRNLSPNSQGSRTSSGVGSLESPSNDPDGEHLLPALFHAKACAVGTDPLTESAGPPFADTARSSAKTTPESCATLVDEPALSGIHTVSPRPQHASAISCVPSPPPCESQTVCNLDEPPRPVAVKLIDKARLARRRQFVTSFQVELRLAATLRHPSIIAVHGVVEEDAELLLVMDIAEGGSLNDYARHHGQEEMWEKAPQILADIVLGLEYLFALGIAHRDIKPDNVLLTADHHARLADFGTACYLDDAEANKFGGTAAYMSPEVVETGSATATSDLWALGCVLYELFIGRSPFHGETSVFVMRKIKQYRSGAIEYPAYFPAAARDLVEQLIRREPDERLGSTQTGGFPALKAHAFFANVDWSCGAARPIPRAVDYTTQVRQALAADERVLRCAMIVKKGGFMRNSRERLLVLTDKPRLFYAHPVTLDVRQSIPITCDVYAEVESPLRFRVVAPKFAGGRTYVFRDLAQHAEVWGALINECAKDQTPAAVSDPFLSLPTDPREKSSGDGAATHCDAHVAPPAQRVLSFWSVPPLFGSRTKSGEEK